MLFFLSLGEPPLLHTFALVEDLFNAPEAGEGENAKEYGKDLIGDYDGEEGADDAAYKECPPTFHAEVVLSFDHQRMEYTYYKKGG